MVDGRSKRKAKIIPFIDSLEKDRKHNLSKLIETAKLLKPEGFEKINWNESTWIIEGGRLLKQSGKNTNSISLKFVYPVKLGNETFTADWESATKSLLLLRFHRKHQSTPNQRNFITAIGYIAFSADKLGLSLSKLTPEALDNACKLISEHYKETTAYNLHKAVAEFAGHCDANCLCCIEFKYKYAKLKRPVNTGGIGYKRLDNPEVTETKNGKIIDPNVFKIIGKLYKNLPKNHKYRFYILLLTLISCLGRRFSEISLLPYQSIQHDTDGRQYIEYFPRKMSQGDKFTPKRKLYLPTEIAPIIHDVFEELDTLCLPAKETAIEMHRVQGIDLRFLSKISHDKKLYKEDLISLGISASVLSVNGWIRKNNLSAADTNRLTKQGIKSANPPHYTDKNSVEKYCNLLYSENSFKYIHKDQNGKKYFLKDIMLIRHMGLSSGKYAHWFSTQCTHSMFTTFMRYFPNLAKEYAFSTIKVDFSSHYFRHTMNTLLDEGGLTDLLQTEWFGRSNPRDTKAYQHTSREKRALMLRADLKEGKVDGKLAEQIKAVPVNLQDAILEARVNAVHDVGSGICIHNFSQLPCERNLQCSADCNDYVWVKEDKGRVDEQKRLFAMTLLSRKTAEKQSTSSKPKKSIDWLAHSDKKLKTLAQQLIDNGVDINNFDADKYFLEIVND